MISVAGRVVAKARASISCMRFRNVRKLHGESLGFIGLGKIGSAIAGNVMKAGASVTGYDRDEKALHALKGDRFTSAQGISEVASKAKIILTIVPDDSVLRIVAEELLPALDKGCVHISCSTVAPQTSRDLAEAHAVRSVGFVSAPVFARPDGMQRGEATIPISGPAWAKALAQPILEKTAISVHDFGEDAGAANAVKLGGNFLIAAAIQSLAEAAALAESNGVDRKQFVSLMNSTIFDCLIYRGYGQRVSERDHFAYPNAHFALDLGSKDIRLTCETASHSRCPMPIASLIRDRFVAAQNRGRGKLDWSALALQASEDAGVDISEALAKSTKA